jgi:single-stranded-DNA-specific exonuclease
MRWYNTPVKYSIRRSLTPDERNRFGTMPELTSHLLFHRGIQSAEEAEDFIYPDYDFGTHDPFLLKDAEKAALRIISAFKNNEKIAVYADYDADGIPGAALFNDFLKRINYENFITYIPHRHNEGFGLNADAVDTLAEQGVKLIITIDCGISDVAPVAHAMERGVEVIITDHHEPPPELPAAFAIVDHKQPDCTYPDKNLCGSGMAFKLIQAILKKDRLGLKEGHEKWLLDLVGIATMSDMVPLTGENRIFAYYGLQVLRKTPRKGLVRLLEKLRIPQRHLTEDDIAFMITPRINAASRMGVPMDAFKLLAADNDADAEFAASHLDEINNERKGVVASLVKEVKKTIKDRHGESIPSVIVLGNPEWRPALLGLAANTCAEEFRRPVFLWGRDGENVIKGSCRSEGQTHLVELMRAVPAESFIQFGGHRFSGGFEVGNEAIHYLEQRLNEAAEKILNSKSETLNKSETQNPNDSNENGEFIDDELKLEEVTWRLFDEINKLAPFGIGNEKPVFLFRNVSAATVRTFGKTNDHVELGFKKANGSTLPAISFFGVTSEWAERVKPNQALDLVASIEKSMFRGRPELRLRVVDVI